MIVWTFSEEFSQNLSASVLMILHYNQNGRARRYLTCCLFLLGTVLLALSSVSLTDLTLNFGAKIGRAAGYRAPSYRVEADLASINNSARKRKRLHQKNCSIADI